MIYYSSPLRYPGGKGSIAHIIGDIILYNNLEGCNYVEPYAGGAGVGLYLLYNKIVSKIYINDADFAVYAFWHSVLFENDRFLTMLKNINITIDEWYRQKEIYENSSRFDTTTVGFATFFLNRTNRSGIINGAGPIGGYSQAGKWKLGVRFNKESLRDRIKILYSYREAIAVYNLDAVDFIEKVQRKKKGNYFAYLDPPYFKNGRKLYLNYYNSDDHKFLSDYILNQSRLPWVITYDKCQQIKKLYQNFRMYQFDLKYSLQNKKDGEELIIFSNQLSVPNLTRFQIHSFQKAI